MKIFQIVIFAAISFLMINKVWANPDEQVIIRMTKNGFEPNQVSVSKDVTVKFLNDDIIDRWPASEVHPTHTIYRQFDTKKPIKPGQVWEFKFLRSGSFKYHDHLTPHFKGVITVGNGQVLGETYNIWSAILERVTSLLNKIKDAFSKKFSSPPDIQTFKDLSQNEQYDVLKKISQPLAAWSYVKKAYENEPGQRGAAHDLAHFMGSLIYEAKGFDGIEICTPNFAFGCYHGFLDQAFAKSLDSIPDAEESCSKIGNPGPVASCIHGIGHGVASFYKTTDLTSALKACEGLKMGQAYCFDGVFMEFVRSAPDDFYKKDDPLYPCNSLEKEFGPAYSFSCGRNQPSLLMSRFKIGFDGVVRVCLSSSSKPFKEACSDALGFSLAASSDQQQIIQGCGKIGVLEYILRCTKAGAGELVFQEAPGWQEKSEAVCNSNPAGRDDCLKHLEKLILEYGRKTRLPARQEKISYQPIKDGEDLNLYLRREIKKCYDTGGKDGCYKDVAALLYDQFGLKKTLELLKTNEDHQEVYARCHEVTHYLSRAEYQNLSSIAGVYAKCDSTCHGGCYHGTLEAYLKQKQTDDVDLAKHFPTVCGKPSDYQKPLEFNECLHGMGHAAMFVTEMELMVSLRLCDTILDQAQKERCYTGVFMENSSSSTSFDHQSKYLKADDPFYPCNSLEEKYQKLCWQYQSSYFSIISNQNWLKVADMCLQIPQKYQDFCFRTIGTNQVGYTPSLKIMKEDCDLMPSEHFQDICVAGVISSFAYRFVGDVGKMIEFCNLVEPENKEACFKQAGTSFTDWTTDKAEATRHCSKIPDPKGLSWCLSAI